MKKFLLLLTLFCAMFIGTVKATDVEIGVDDATVATATTIPINALWKYGWSQQIYTPDEIGMAGTINSITFWMYHTGSNPPAYNISVYMAEVSEDEFASTTSWVALSASDLVFSGTAFANLPTTAAGIDEVTIVFDTPFAYSGTSNLLIAFANNTGSYVSGMNARVFGASADPKRTLYKYQDSGAIGPDVPSVEGTLTHLRNVIKLDVTPSGGGGPVCDRPESCDITDITTNGATVNFAGGSGTYNVEYKGANDADWASAVKNTSLTSISLTGLTPNTNYSVRVTSVCGDNTSSSKSANFKTLIGLPFAENFNATSIPDGWSMPQGKLNADGSVTFSGTTGWNFGSNNGVFDSHARSNIYSNYQKWLILPEILIPAIEEGDLGYQLSFNLALTKYSGTLVPVEAGKQADDRFIVLASLDGGVNWNILQEWNNTGSPYVYDNIACTAEGDEAVIDISAYAGQSIKLAFYGESTVAGGDNNIHVDNVLIDRIPTCLKPTLVHEVEGAATQSSLQVAWTANSGETAWRVQYKPTADATAEWITFDAETNPYTISGLQAFTNYDVRVAAVCSETDFTDYGKAIIAKTAAGVPYAETFDTTALPGEWKRYEVLLEDLENDVPMEPVSDGWDVAAANGVFPTANRHLVLNIAGTDCKYWILGPTIEMEAGYQLTFDLALTDAAGTAPAAVTPGAQNDDKFIVFISNNGGESWTTLGRWDNAGGGFIYDAINAEGQTATFDLSAYAGQSIRLAFYGESKVANANNNLHLANVKIDLIPDCSPASSLVIDNLTHNSASAVWTFDEAEASWKYGFIANPATDFAPAEDDFTFTTTEQIAQMPSLEPSTNYAFFLRHECSDASSEVLIRNFTTFAAPKSVPYVETFEAMDANTVPTQWDNSASTTSTVTTANPHYVWGVYSYSGNKMIRMYNFYVQSGTALINSPRIVLPSEDISLLKFDYAHTATCGNFTVKISADNGKTWNELGSYGKTSTGTSSTDPGEFTTVEKTLEAYLGQTVILQFFANANYGSGSIFVDNISITQAPACMKPSGLALTAINSQSATLAWNEETDGSSWVYALTPDSAEVPADSSYIPVDINSIELTSLEPNTSYVFYLRKACTDQYSEEFISVAFKTLPNPMALPFSENFNALASGIPEFWNNDEGTTTTATSKWNRYVISASSDTCLRFNSYSNSNGNTNILATPRIALTEDAMLSFRWKNPTGGSAQVLISTDGGVNRTPLESQLTNIADWTTFEINLADYTNEIVTIYFLGISNYGNGDAYLYLDDVEVKALPSCMKPTALAVVDSTLTANSIQIDWIPGLNEEHWFVQYKKASESEWSYVADSVNAHPFTIDGLDPATLYNIRVAAWCDIADSTAISEYSAIISQATECAAVAAISEDFENDLMCWNFIQDGEYPVVLTNYPADALSGTKFLYAYTDGTTAAIDQYIILPELNSLDGKRIKFYACKDMADFETATLVVGVMDDPGADSTFVSLDTILLNSATYAQSVVPFTAYTGEAKYVAIKFLAASYQTAIRVEDVVVEAIPMCIDPAGLHAIADSIATNSVVLAWTPQGPESDWLVRYKLSGAAEWTDTIHATSDTLKLEGLAKASSYEAQVAAWCDPTDPEAVSPYSGSAIFATSCGTYSITEEGIFSEGFEDYVGVAYNSAFGVVPTCWETGGTTTYPAPHVVVDGQYAYVHSGSNGLNFCGSANSYAYAALPQFAEPLNSLQIGFWAKVESTTAGNLLLGYVTSDDVSTFQTIATVPCTTTMKKFEYMLDTLPAAATRLVIVWEYSGSSYYSAGIDDIEVSLIPTCLKPQGLEAVLTPANGSVATLNWKAGASEEAWVVEYATKADFSNALSIEASDSTANLSGLLSDTTYYARVKAVCSATDESYWSDAISFVPTDALIVNDSTATNSYVPFYGYYVHYDVQSQFVVPASELNAIAWDSITSLTFFSSTATAALTGAKFDVYVAEVEESTVSAMKPWTAMEKVVADKHLSVANKQMVVAFDEPYQYQGGNLLIGFKLSTPASSSGTTVSWYGKSNQTGASMGGYKSTASGTISISQRNFAPKMRIDHVPGVMPSCLQVKNLATSGLTAHSAILSWTNGDENQNAWEIAYSLDADFNPEEVNPLVASANPFSLEGLEADTTYYVYVRANCGDDGYSVWSKLYSFHTASLCQTPDELAAAPGLTSAEISWNTYGQTGFNLRYIQGTDTTLVPNVESPYEITGLQANTAYKVQVQAACEAAESWSAALSFKTAYGIPFEEKFATTSQPADWARYSGLLSEVLAGGALTTTTSGWNFGTANGVFDNHAKINIYSTTYKYWLATPAIYVSGNVQLTFDLALTKYSGTLTPVDATQQEDDKFVVLISTDNGDSWSVLRQWDNAGSEYVYNNIACAAAGEPVAIDLSAYDGQAIKIAFYGESTESGGDNNLHIDNVLIDLVPTCLKPTGFSISDVKAHSAQLSWTAGDEGQSAWQIAIDTLPTNRPDTLLNIIDVTENPYVLTGLDPETRYYAYVRANCGATDGVSRWTDGQTFKTTIACPAPVGLAAVLTPGNGSIATLTWNASEAQGWQVEYSLNSDLSDSIVALASDTFVNLSGLTAEATYYARIKADCGDLDGESLYSAIISFKPTDAYELLINDGTATNEYVPVYGYWTDNLTRSQFIIPEADLEEIEWDSIKSLTFYSSSTNTNWDATSFEVYVAEAPETTMSELNDWNAMTMVVEAASLNIVSGQMVITFDEAYQYQGGNLLIGIKQTVSTTSTNAKHTYWYGVSANGASFGGYGDGNNVAQRNFLPKMLINYVPGVAPACPNPKNLAVSGITDSEATFTWKAVEGATWEYALVEGAADPASFIATEENSITIAELAESTDYTFYLRRACGVDGYSDATLSVAFTTDVHVEAVPFVEDFEADGSWKFVNGTEPNAWVIGEAAANGGEKALYISNDNGASNTYTKDAASASFATILLNFDQAGEYTFAYDWKANGDFSIEDNELYDYLRVVLVPASATLVAGDPALPADYIALDNGGLYGATEWQHHSSDAQIEAGQYKLVFAWFNDESDGDDAPAAIDNISIQEKGPETGLIEGNAGIFNDGKAFKFLRDNKVFILVNGVIYDATGRKVEVVK